MGRANHSGSERLNLDGGRRTHGRVSVLLAGCGVGIDEELCFAGQP